MDADKFLTGYMAPCQDRFDRSFALPLPRIEGLEKRCEFIVEGRLEDTVSTNVITQYRSERLGVRLSEVYKATENQKTGVFVRLVGTISAVKKGYPFFFLDAAVSNVDPRTAERVDLTTLVAVHSPQAGAKRRIFTEALDEQARAAGIACGTVQVPVLPDFWGPLWHVRSAGADLELIRRLREFAWEAYGRYCQAAEANPDFDYRPTQDHMIYRNSEAEHRMFQKMGLSVAAEAQAAFFSVLCVGA